MKRKLSTTKVIYVLGAPIKGPEMAQYGLPNLNHPGLIGEHHGKGSVKKMLDIIDLFYPEIHIVTFLENGNIVNRYEKDGASFYRLFKGNADPNLEFVYDDDSRRSERETWQFIMEVMRGEHAELFEDVDLDDL